LLDPLSTERIKDPAAVVAGTESASLVDRYTALVRMMRLEAARDAACAAPTIAQALQTLSGVRDDGLRALRLIYLGGAADPPSPKRFEPYDQYTRGDYAAASDLCVRELLERPATSSLYELMVSAEPC